MTSKLKRYIVFNGAVYYPSEGMGDFVHTCDSEPEAIAIAGKLCQKDSLTWSQVFDTHEFKIIKMFYHANDGMSSRNDEWINNQINAYLT